MKSEETIRTAMDRRLAFLDERPSCRAAVQYRIAKEEPVMKKKITFGFVLAMVLGLISIAGVAAGIMLSVRASAVQAADRVLEEKYGITQEMQTFFERKQEELPDGTVRVTYAGAGSFLEVLGTYTVTVRDKSAEAEWSYDGKDISGGYASEVWGIDQLKQMVADGREGKTEAVLKLAEEIATRHGAPQDLSSSEADVYLQEMMEAAKNEAMNARVLPEEEMIRLGREFIVSNYALNEDQTGRMELFTKTGRGNEWYDMIGGKPCFMVEYLLYAQNGMIAERISEKDGYYVVYINVTDGTVEDYTFNSGLGGIG